MALYVQAGPIRKKFRWSLVLGREDFPDDQWVSRKHVKFFVKGGRIFVKDLGSHNGTFVKGERLAPYKALEIHPMDKVRIGEQELIFFRIESVNRSSAAPEGFALHLFFFIYALLCAVTLCEPTLAFGRSIGVVNAGFVLGCLALSTGISYVAWMWTMNFNVIRWFRTAFFTAVVCATAMFLHALLMFQVDKSIQIGQAMVTAKIHYFCVENFDQSLCVEQVAYCPSCALTIDKWERDAAVEKLKGFRAQYPAEAVARLKAQEQTRQPAQSPQDPAPQPAPQTPQ